MVLSRRLLWMIFAIAGFSGYSLNNPYLIASTSHDRYRIEKESEDIPVTVEMNGDSCDQVTCMNLYPANGKIEGKPVSQMTPSGINSLGQVVGRCNLAGYADPFAFFREPDGKVWIFRTPTATGQGEFTDVNDSGAAVGFYENDSARTNIGFLMNSSRKWVTDIQYPENACPDGKSYLHTQPNGINSNGEIVGNYGCTARPEDAAEVLFNGDGFYRAPDGTFYRVQYENAVRTVAGKISDTGVIVGYYVLDNNVWVPFAAMKEDVIRPIDRSESRLHR
jgi:hypothetical protein